ncbi:MAG: ATP-binding protein [Burkholderiaceae bacterium]
MKSLRARVLLLIVGFAFVMAALLAIIMHASVRQYYNDWLYEKSSSFAERVLAAHPDLWQDYQRDPAGFGARLRQYILYSPNTGLYLLDPDGRVLASAGEGKLFWSNYRVDLTPIREVAQGESPVPIVAADPDSQGKSCLVAARPVMENGQIRGWLYVVARQADFGTAMPELLKSYAIRTAAKVGLMTIAIGGLLTIAMITLLTRPLTSLTRATEQVRNSGFCDELCDSFFTDSERDDEIGRLSRTFREAFDRLKHETELVRTVDSKRREMVASVSHDLRTPLTALIGQLETIRLKREQLTPSDRQQLLERAILNAHHMKRLTDALAELAKLDNPDFRAQPEPIAIGELADDVVQRYVASAQSSGVKLEIDYPDGLPLTKVDAALIERALANLLDNALRVTPAGGRVLVRALRDGDGIRLEVADSGPGVLPEDQPRVFERFYQSSRHREQRGSSGLGLAIVKRVAELHGGQAGLRSEPGRGSTFFIELPLAAA